MSEALSEEERDWLHDIWSEDSTVSAASFFPAVARIKAAAATRARAEALREAARDLPGLDTIRTHGDAAKWLRARAERLDTPDTPARTIPTTATVRDGLAADTAADNKVRWNRALKGGA